MPAEKDETPSAPGGGKGLRFVVQLWGMISAVTMISTGLFVILTGLFSADCFIAGIVQVSVGVLVVPLEAPVFCTSFERLTKVSDFVERTFRYWMRAGLYLILAIVPLFLCLELSTFIGCGALGILAALHCLLTIGKRGKDAETKTTREFSSTANKDEDIEMRANLITATGDPNELNTY